jgi:hypothetical protein
VTNKQPQTPDRKPQISKQPVKTPKPAKVEFDLPDEDLEKVSGGGTFGGSNLGTVR